jgi:hypothetical protein
MMCLNELVKKNYDKLEWKLKELILEVSSKLEKIGVDMLNFVFECLDILKYFSCIKMGFNNGRQRAT